MAIRGATCLVNVQRVGEFLDVEGACRGVYNVLVDAAFPVETVRIAGLFDTAVSECIDDVAVDDLGDTVGYYHDGSVTLDGIDAGLDLFGSDCVQAGGRFVKEDDRRVLEEETGDSYSLLLTS